LNPNPVGVWCYAGLDSIPSNLNGNTTWRLPNPFAINTPITLQFSITLCQITEGVFMRFSSNIRAFNSNEDQTSVTDSSTKILKKTLPIGTTWNGVIHMLKVRVDLASHQSSSSISDKIGIYLWEFNFYSGGMLTDLGY
jgi:hypothetical protein